MKALTIATLLVIIAPTGLLAADKSSPLYTDNATRAENPLYTEQSVSNPGGNGTSEGKAKVATQQAASATAAKQANHNTIRANRVQPAASDSGSDNGSGTSTSPATRAQDYNSSRSNTTTAIEKLDDDDDGDSITETKVDKFQVRQDSGQTRQTRDRN